MFRSLVIRVIPLDSRNNDQPADSYYDITDPHTSSAPYTATKPVSKQPTTTTTTTVVHKQTEVHELAPRKPTDPSRSQPSAFHKPAAQSNNRRGQRHNDYASSDNDKITSHF
jgi:hypothetical protein